MNKKEIEEIKEGVNQLIIEREKFIESQANSFFNGWRCSKHNVFISKGKKCPLCELSAPPKTKEEEQKKELLREKERERKRKEMLDPEKRKRQQESLKRFREREKLRKKEHTII